jgi:hypothetical protein
LGFDFKRWIARWKQYEATLAPLFTALAADDSGSERPE